MKFSYLFAQSFIYNSVILLIFIFNTKRFNKGS